MQCILGSIPDLLMAMAAGRDPTGPLALVRQALTRFAPLLRLADSDGNLIATDDFGSGRGRVPAAIWARRKAEALHNAAVCQFGVPDDPGRILEPGSEVQRSPPRSVLNAYLHVRAAVFTTSAGNGNSLGAVGGIDRPQFGARPLVRMTHRPTEPR